MKFLIVLAFVGLAAADVSHLASSYLPPRVSSNVVNYNQGYEASVSRPVVSTYTTQQQVQPQITYSRQVVQPSYQVQPSVQVIGGGYDSGLIGSGISGNSLIGGGLSSGSYGGDSGLISAYDSGLSGGNIYQGGLIDSGYQSSGQLIGGGGLVGSGISGLSGLSGGSNVYRSNVISAPVISNSYETVDTQYGNNGGYVYEKRH